jgi:anti-sigma factor (TIGR02949 family)
MLCRDIQRVVYFFLDGSLGEQKKQDYSSHLKLCPDCEARTKFHGRIRNFVQSRLARITAPERLKMRLARSLRAFRTEWSR